MGVGLVSLTDVINTTSAQGRLVFNLFASLAEFERELIRERTHAGLAAARARGRVGGRQRGLSEQAERTAIIAETLYREQQLGVNEIAQRLNISKVTLYKSLRYRKVVINAHRKTVAAKATVQPLYQAFNQGHFRGSLGVFQVYKWAKCDFWTKLLTKAKIAYPTSLEIRTGFGLASRCARLGTLPSDALGTGLLAAAWGKPLAGP